MKFTHNGFDYKLMRVEEDSCVLKRRGHPEETFSKSFMKKNFKKYTEVDRNGLPILDDSYKP